jgi:hypothetical protein
MRTCKEKNCIGTCVIDIYTESAWIYNFDPFHRKYTCIQMIKLRTTVGNNYTSTTHICMKFDRHVKLPTSKSNEIYQEQKKWSQTFSPWSRAKFRLLYATHSNNC